MKHSKLLKKNKEYAPKTFEAVYGFCVEKELEKRGYTVGRIQAIINNYLGDPSNDKYVKEFTDLQNCRNKCKAKIKAELEIE